MMIDSVLFVCTGNACRSQMAEGLARHLLPPHVGVASAGTRVAAVDPRAVRTLAGWGLDISDQTTKSLHQLDPAKFGLVVTLCSDAESSCATIPSRRKQHWPIDDPAAAAGSAADVERAFLGAASNLLERITLLAQSVPVEPAIGILGGSGFYDLPGLTEVTQPRVATPFGATSDDLVCGRLGGRKLVFLPRHGRGHTLLPSEVNARANIYALKRMGVTRLISISAVGSLREEIAPGDVVLATQFIDRTQLRPNTFFGDGVVAHVSLADPVCPSTHAIIDAAARAHTNRVHARGTYVCIEGPQFSTRAESELMRSWGADLVGMTVVPEARLAREAEICYAPLCLPTDYDCWHPAENDVQVEDILATLRNNVVLGQRVLASAVERLDPAAPCGCHRTLDTALLTPRELVAQRPRVRLHAIMNRMFGAAAPPQKSESRPA